LILSRKYEMTMPVEHTLPNTNRLGERVLVGARHFRHGNETLHLAWKWYETCFLNT